MEVVKSRTVASGVLVAQFPFRSSRGVKRS
jgi:hypothetical protein